MSLKINSMEKSFEIDIKNIYLYEITSSGKEQIHNLKNTYYGYWWSLKDKDDINKNIGYISVSINVNEISFWLKLFGGKDEDGKEVNYYYKRKEPKQEIVQVKLTDNDEVIKNEETNRWVKRYSRRRERERERERENKEVIYMENSIWTNTQQINNEKQPRTN